MARPLRLLVVEDNPADAELLIRELKRGGFEPEWRRVWSESEYLNELHEGLDLVISDFEMPGFDGLRALELLKTKGLEVPFIIVSGYIDEVTAVSAMKRGASDYLLKDRMARLVPAIELALEQTRLQREQALARTTLELREQALAQVSQGVLISDEQRIVIYANESFTKITGYGPEEILGKNCGFLQGPGTDPASVQRMRAALNTGAPFEGQILNYRKDGTEFWNELSIAPIRHTDGTPTGFIGILRDVTESKLSREALQRSEEQVRRERALLRALIDSIPDIIFFKDKNSAFLGCNKAFETHSGLSEEEIIGKTDCNVVPREIAEEHRSTDRELLSSGKTLRTEEWIPFGVGGGGYFETIKTAYFGPEGESLGLIGVSRDITERKKAEEARLLASERLKLATTASEVGIWEMDLVSGRMIWDGQMRKLYGVPEGVEDVVAFAFGIMLGEDVDRVRRLFEEAQSPAGTGFNTEFRIRGDDKRTHFIRATATVVRNAAGEPQWLVGINWDVTEERERERDLTEALALEKELSEKARAGDRAKSEFLAVMSHEVRTPLNGIIGFAELLARASSISPKHLDYANTIVRSGESLLRILDDILDFSRLEAGRMEVVSAPFAPRELLQDIRHLMAQQAAEKNIDIAISVAEAVPEFLDGDCGRLRQILLNIVGNAIKFTERGSVSVGLRFLPEQPSTFVFTVKDTGVGIKPEQIERIFQPFTQADSSISRRYGGTGLGLAISRRLAELLGGQLSARSEPEVGAEFYLTLRMNAALRPAEDGSRALEPLDAMFATRHPLKILVVEDDRINLKLIQALLRRLGYQPCAANNGVEAVQVYKSEQPDCVLMDLQMPEMDGIEATATIRGLEPLYDRPPAFVSALTANIFPADRQRCFDVGMNFYLNKPVKIASLAEVLVRAADLRRARAGELPA